WPWCNFTLENDIEHHYHRRHRFVGHLFQGRFKSPLIQRDGYWLSCRRDVERNPVEAGVVAEPWVNRCSSAAAYWTNYSTRRKIREQRAPADPPSDLRMCSASGRAAEPRRSPPSLTAAASRAPAFSLPAAPGGGSLGRCCVPVVSDPQEALPCLGCVWA